MHILELLLLLPDSLYDPVATGLEKEMRSGIWNDIRNRNAHALQRMNPYAHTAAADALAERHLPISGSIYVFSPFAIQQTAYFRQI